MPDRFKIICFAVSLLAFSAMSSPSVEALGGINSSVFRATDALGGNPACLGINKNHQISASANRYWLGLPGEALFGSRIAYSSPQSAFGVFGIELRQLGLGVQSRFDVIAGYSYPIIFSDGLLSAGVSGRWVRNQYDLSRAYRFENDPLFDRLGTASDGFGFDAGFLFEKGSFRAGICAMNILKPSLSLEGGVEEGEAEPRKMALSISYSPLRWAIPIAQMEWHETEKWLGAFGIEFRLMRDLLRLRAGYSKNSFSFGIGMEDFARFPLAFDYSLKYPQSDLSKAGITTHGIGATVEIKPREKKPRIYEVKTPLIDVAAMRDMGMPKAIGHVGDTLRIRAIIVNLGSTKLDSIPVFAFAEGPETTLIGDAIYIRSLESGEEKNLVWNWVPRKAGNYKMVVNADDDGTRFPLRSGRFVEADEANNKIEIPVDVIGETIAKLEVKHPTLDIQELTYIAEEEPFVPMVFFDAGRTSVSPRFDAVLSVLANRMKENTDVIIKLLGYVDPNSDPRTWEGDSLHIKRALEVKRKLVSLGAPEKNIEIVVQGYNPASQRVSSGEGSLYETDTDRLWAEQENRRVEMRAVIKSLPEKLFSYDFKNHRIELTESTKDSIVAIACGVSNILEKNPSTIIIFEGEIPTSSQVEPIFSLMDGLREKVLSSPDCKYDISRFPNILRAEENFEPSLNLIVSGDALLYKPIDAALASKDFVIPQEFANNEIYIEIEEGNISEYRVFVVDSKGAVFRNIEKGTGTPPKKLLWNWRDDNGNLIDPRETYRVKLETKDPIGYIQSFLSREVRLKVSGRERIRESSIIVQFAFDEVTPTSIYLESRLESMAKEIVETAKSEKTRLTVKLLGHTDPIGTDRRNMILSQKRAEKEEMHLRKYLWHELGIQSDVELDSWLARNRVSFIGEGLADKEPYEIERYRDGKFEKVLIGNNAFPEGRSVNRRVVIEVELVRDFR